MVEVLGIIILACFVAAVTFVLIQKQLYLWIFPYYRQKLVSAVVSKEKKTEEQHIIICICDHCDFGSRGVFRPGEADVVKTWEEKFPKFSQRHKDSVGINLQHTWFFPPHYHRADYLEKLVQLCSKGYGEIEMHLHHDHMPPYADTSQTLRKKVKDCIASYSKLGVFCLPNGEKTFGFIHGDWALDNSRKGKYCGVNDEIRILGEEGCYADFTFPSLGEAQPSKINSIYYVLDDPSKPKSYNTGVDVTVGGKAFGDLMLIQGPLELRFKRNFGIPFYPAIEAAALEESSTLSMQRVIAWLKANIHIKGRPEWIFVKLHTHGLMMQNFDHNFGELAETFFTDLEKKYNNPKDGYLHYVTARQMYNIVKAAEAGKTGNPADYCNYLIPKYVYLKD